uniref:VHS domain-containing protein n=1 Tax=Hyaloperonospora arabidopsidis (strain Emoy2) TaxID=559515 RepID=M4BWH7_HYAAE
MDATMQSWRKKMPSTRQLTSTINQLVQQKSVAVLYTPTEVERIQEMTDMIAQATSDFEADEDWDRILRVVDALSNIRNRAVLKESIRYLKLRLGDSSSRVVILALTLTESIVKNCGDLVHQEIATEPFMNEMEALYRVHAARRGRASMEIASRVLDMIQAWGEAFLPFRNEFPLFVDTYHNMRKKGVKFPDQYDESKVPVLTPSSSDGLAGSRSGAANAGSVLSNSARETSSIDTSSYSNSSSKLGGLSTPELYRVATNVAEMFEDMLYEAQKQTSGIGNHGVMEELALEVREILHRMEGAIPIALAEEDAHLEKYLSINDGLYAALEKYDLLLLARNENAEEKKTAAKSERELLNDVDLVDPFGLKMDPSPPNNPTTQDLIDDDDSFADFVHARTGSKIENVGQNKGSANKDSIFEVEDKSAFPVLQQEQEVDPFVSFVQQRATKILSSNDHNSKSETKPAATAAIQLADPAKDLIDLWDDTAAPAHVVAQPSVEPALWLEDDLTGFSSQPSTDTLYKPNMSVLSQPRLCSTTSSTIVNGSSSRVPTKAPASTLASSNPFDTLAFASPTISQQPSRPAATLLELLRDTHPANFTILLWPICLWIITRLARIFDTACFFRRK